MVKRGQIVLGTVLALGIGVLLAKAFTPKPRLVMIISVDTLRADHLGLYGHPEKPSPFIDGFAEEAVVFENHMSAAPTTLNSHTALMTGTYGNRHGVPRNVFTVADDNVMLAEILSDEGWDTAAFLGAMPLGSKSGFTQGFRLVDENFSRRVAGGEVDQTQRRADEVTDAVLDWSRHRSPFATRPTFLFVHYFDVHAPYDPPEPYRSQFGEVSDKRAGNLKHVRRTRSLGKDDPGAISARSEDLRKLYLGEVAWTDKEVGRLLNGMDAGGWLDDALIIITSDHGETQDTHSEVWNHGYTLYDETIRTPLIVRFPDETGAGTRVKRLVSNVDVMPTVLEWLGLPLPNRVEGRSVMPLLNGTQMTPATPVFSESTKPYTPVGDSPWPNDLRWKASRDERYKLLFHPADGAYELYDLRDDPGETHNLFPIVPDLGLEDRLQTLTEAVHAFRDRADPLPVVEQGSETVHRQLEALGYVDHEQ